MKKSYFILIFIIGVIITTIIMLKTRNANNYFYNKDFNIPEYISLVDKDNDGVDDQSDILNNVKEYLKTKPKYKSKYYGTGYPDDEYGVCTDVVARGLFQAGYDLQKLVDTHIRNNRGLYKIDKVDSNIDFRRVRNLKVYFDNTGILLSLNPKEIDEWQGGDIVIFPNHIGIVSDKRNSKGIPYVFHHANPFQLSYEEDILGSNYQIIGHYRIS